MKSNETAKADPILTKMLKNAKQQPAYLKNVQRHFLDSKRTERPLPERISDIST